MTWRLPSIVITRKRLDIQGRMLRANFLRNHSLRGLNAGVHLIGTLVSFDKYARRDAVKMQQVVECLIECAERIGFIKHAKQVKDELNTPD